MPDSTQKAKDKVTKLHEEIRVIELEASLAENIVTTNVLHGSKDTTDLSQGREKEEQPLQGPIVEAEIHLEGHQTKALIDTGSPTYIDCIN